MHANSNRPYIFLYMSTKQEQNQVYIIPLTHLMTHTNTYTLISYNTLPSCLINDNSQDTPKLVYKIHLLHACTRQKQSINSFPCFLSAIRR